MFASATKASPRTVLLRSRCVPEHASPSLSRNDQDRVGECLRAMYDELREEPLPPRLEDLVRRLAQGSAE